MPNFARVRVLKLAAGSLGGVGRHNDRGVGGQTEEVIEIIEESGAENETKRSNPFIDKERTKFNQDLLPKERRPEGKTRESQFKHRLKELKEKYPIVGRPRLAGELKQQSKVVCALVFPSPYGFARDSEDKIIRNQDGSGKVNEPEKTKKFFEECLAFVDKKFGRDCVLSAKIHMDESNPHAHIEFIPLVKATKVERIASKKGTSKATKVWTDEILKDSQGREQYKVSMSGLFHGFNSFGQLQTELAEHIQRTLPDVQRGIPKKEKSVDYKPLETLREQTRVIQEAKVSEGAKVKRVASIEAKPTVATVVRRGFRILLPVDTEKYGRIRKPSKDAHIFNLAGVFLRNLYSRLVVRPDVAVLPTSAVRELKESAQNNFINHAAFSALSAQESALKAEKEKWEREKAERERVLKDKEQKIKEYQKTLNDSDLGKREKAVTERENSVEIKENNVSNRENRAISREYAVGEREQKATRREQELPTKEQYQAVLLEQRNLIEVLAAARIPTDKAGEVWYLQPNAIRAACEAFNANASKVASGGGGWVPPIARSEIVISRSKEIEKSRGR